MFIYLVVDQKGAVAVLERGVGVEHGIIRLHNGGGHLDGGIFSSLPFWEAHTRQHCRLSICEYWLGWTNTVSEAKIQITLLILNGDPV